MTMILKKDFTSFNYRLFVLPAFMRAFLSRVRRMANFPIIQKSCLAYEFFVSKTASSLSKASIFFLS